MQDVQIYLGEERLDLFEDENISLTQTIKNIKDISKIQTDFSQDFTVPASKNNNKVFRHFYNSSVSYNDFDARFLKKASIKLNGVDFKEGRIRLLGVKMKNDKPYSYKIGFIGETVSLKDMFSDDELSDLPYLDVFDHEYTYNNVKTYMQTGYNFTGSGNTSTFYPDMTYPFISSDSRYYFDPAHGSHDAIPRVRNIYNPSPSSFNSHSDYHSILMYDLKPAIKVYYILKAIEEKYGFTFSDDFFDQDSLVFEQLYLWCSRKAGSLQYLKDEKTKEVKFEDLVLTSGTEVREGSNTSFTASSESFKNWRYTYRKYLQYQATIDVVGSGSYDLVVYDVDTNETYGRKRNVTGSQTVNETFKTTQNFTKTFKPAIKITTEGGITSFSSSNVVLTRTVFDDEVTTITTSNYTIPTQVISDGLDFRNSMLPKMKVLDFLKGLFNMFNLVAYFEGTELVVKTLNDYYLNSSHEKYNIDKYVDSSSVQVSRSNIYSEINYEFAEPKTIFALKSNEATGDEFGNERFKSEGDDSFDGGKYDVKVKFGHMVYENLIDLSDGSFSYWDWGYSVDKDENPVLEAPLLFYGTRKGIAAQDSDVFVTDKPVGETSGSYSCDEVDYLQTPRNTNYDPFDTDPDSINFGSEYTVFGNEIVNNSLFKVYHEGFISNIYDPSTRIVKITAHLPLSILLKYELNDRFIYKGVTYFINSIKTNLQTGKSELELLTDNYPE